METPKFTDDLTSMIENHDEISPETILHSIRMAEAVSISLLNDEEFGVDEFSEEAKMRDEVKNINAAIAEVSTSMLDVEKFLEKLKHHSSGHLKEHLEMYKEAQNMLENKAKMKSTPLQTFCTWINLAEIIDREYSQTFARTAVEFALEDLDTLKFLTVLNEKVSDYYKKEEEA